MKIKIKDIRGKHATGKFQLLDPEAKEGKTRSTNRERGYRALEAGEVVEVSDKDGEAFIKASNGILEITVEEATRPLYFGDIGTARATSSKYNIDSPEREEDQSAAFERVEEMLSAKGTAE